MLVHPHKRQLKVHFENTARTEVTSGPSPYLWQARAENDNRIWQLKSRSAGGGKTSASSKIRCVLTQRLQRASFPPLRAVHRHWLSTDSSPVKASFPEARDASFPDPAWDSFWGRKKTADDARFSPTAQPTCPPSCSNNPEKQLQNVKQGACVNNEPSAQTATATCCCWEHGFDSFVCLFLVGFYFILLRISNNNTLTNLVSSLLALMQPDHGFRETIQS